MKRRSLSLPASFARLKTRIPILLAIPMSSRDNAISPQGGNHLNPIVEEYPGHQTVREIPAGRMQYFTPCISLIAK